MKYGNMEEVQPLMNQPCGLWCLSRGGDSDIDADENGSFLGVTRRKRECIRAGTRQSRQLTVVVSDIAGDRRRQRPLEPANYKRYQTSR